MDSSWRNEKACFTLRWFDPAPERADVKLGAQTIGKVGAIPF